MPQKGWLLAHYDHWPHGCGEQWLWLHTPRPTLQHTALPSPTASPGSSRAGQTLIHGCPRRPFTKGISNHQVQQAETVHRRAAPWLLGSVWGDVQGSQGTGPSGSVSLAVSVPPRLRRVPRSPGTVRQCWLGLLSRLGAAWPVLVRQRDDIIVDARLQLLDLLSRCLGREDSLCLHHRCICHC